MQTLRYARYHSLDFWRGVACLLVVVFHSTFYVATTALEQSVLSGESSFSQAIVWLTSRFWVGVPMFFVISGYCIATAADSTRLRDRRTIEYFRRRFRRIYPPLWIFLSATCLFIGGMELVAPGLLTDSHHPLLAPWNLSSFQILGNLTLTESWRKWIVGSSSRYMVGHIWTLCYEEQFYAVVGVALLLARRRLWLVLCGITVAVAPVLAFRALGYTPIRGFFFDGFWLDFAAGLGVYWCLNHGNRASRFLIAAILVAGILSQAIIAPHLLVSFSANFEQFRCVAFGFALLLLALHPLDQAIAGSRWTQACSWCGIMCYSIYLVHWPICKAISHGLYLSGVVGGLGTLLITIPLCTIASVTAGYAFHVGVERRFLNSPATRPVGTGVSSKLAESCSLTQSATLDPIQPTA